MQKLKALLSSSLGVLGYVLWFLVSAILLYAPLIFLNLPFLIDVIIIFVITSIPFIGGIIEFIIWIWSFVVVLAEPFDGWCVFYLIAFAIYFLGTLLPFIINLIISFITIVFNKNTYR